MWSTLGWSDCRLRKPREPDASGNGEAPNGLAYLFAAEGSGRIVGAGFEAVELPTRGIIAIPAASPAFVVEDLGGLELIRIAPNRPDK